MNIGKGNTDKISIGGAILAAVILAVIVSGCKEMPEGSTLFEAIEGQDEIRAFIGQEGGTLKFTDSGSRLVVPPKVLQEKINMTLRREKPVFDLSKKDFVGRAYRIAPRVTFAPGSAKLFVPIDRPLPGLPAEINLKLYYYDRLESHGPDGPSFVHEWQPHPVARFSGFSQDQRFLVFEISETISDRTTKPPFGLFQAAFDMAE